jgi:hypothetical protein
VVALVSCRDAGGLHSVAVRFSVHNIRVGTISRWCDLGHCTLRQKVSPRPFSLFPPAGLLASAEAKFAKLAACLFRFRIATHTSPPFTVEFPRVLCVLSFFAWMAAREREEIRACVLFMPRGSYTACTMLTLLLICVVGHLAINPGSSDC